MKYLIVTAPEGYRDTVQAVLDGTSLKEIWWETSPSTNDTFTVRLVCDAAEEASLMSSLQKALAGTDKGSIHALNIDSTFPNPKPLFEAPQLSREELFRIADQGARSDSLYLLLVGLSTVVAAIGLLQNNVAVIIGAMVIAPLLGPNLSIALGSALGETSITQRAIKAFLKGCLLSLVVAFLVGLAWPDFTMTYEMESRTSPGLDNAFLAIASGTAAVLSMTSGVYTALVGVMVAVALVPPLATTGILLGHGDINGAVGSLLLLIVNVAAINLASHTTLHFSGIAPRISNAAEKARTRNMLYTLLWLVCLALASLGSYYWLK